MTLPWQDPSLTFRQRCIAWSEAELHNQVCEIPPHSNDGPRIREYFSVPPFVRKSSGGVETPIRVSALPWCAASACMAHHESDISGECKVTPRVSGKEIEDDARRDRRFYIAEDLKQEMSWPEVGDLVIFPRGLPGGWQRHVARVYSVVGATYYTIAGNEDDTWKISGPFPFERVGEPGLWIPTIARGFVRVA